MNEIQILKEELNRLKIDLDFHKQESDRTIMMLEKLIARLLAANIRANVMTQAECSRLLNQLEEEDTEDDIELNFIYGIMLDALRT